MAYRFSQNVITAVNTMCEKHRDITFMGDSYLIRPFKDWSEFLNESTALHHEVYQWAAYKHFKGGDYLFVMRKVSEPETPYITLEFDLDGQLRLARKDRCTLVNNPDEEAFIQYFQDEVLIPYVNNKQKKENGNMQQEHLYTVGIKEKNTGETLKLQVWARNTDEATHKLTGSLIGYPCQYHWTGTSPVYEDNKIVTRKVAE